MASFIITNRGGGIDRISPAEGTTTGVTVNLGADPFTGIEEVEGTFPSPIP